MTKVINMVIKMLLLLIAFSFFSDNSRSADTVLATHIVTLCIRSFADNVGEFSVLAPLVMRRIELTWSGLESWSGDISMVCFSWLLNLEDLLDILLHNWNYCHGRAKIQQRFTFSAFVACSDM